MWEVLGYFSWLRACQPKGDPVLSCKLGWDQCQSPCCEPQNYSRALCLPEAQSAAAGAGCIQHTGNSWRWQSHGKADLAQGVGLYSSKRAPNERTRQTSPVFALQGDGSRNGGFLLQILGVGLATCLSAQTWGGGKNLCVYVLLSCWELCLLGALCVLCTARKT